jgi:hypothetical protein
MSAIPSGQSPAAVVNGVLAGEASQATRRRSGHEAIPYRSAEERGDGRSLV